MAKDKSKKPSEKKTVAKHGMLVSGPALAQKSEPVEPPRERDECAAPRFGALIERDADGRLFSALTGEQRFDSLFELVTAVS